MSCHNFGHPTKCPTFFRAGKLPEQQHSARINVHGPPIAREQTKVKTAEGNSLSLNCPMGGYPIIKVDWKKDGTNFLPNSKKITFPSIKSENSGEYTCTAYDGLGQNATAVIDLEVAVGKLAFYRIFYSLHQTTNFKTMIAEFQIIFFTTDPTKKGQ